MAAYAWVLAVRPGCEEEYKRRHDALWPEMREALRQAGLTSYSIFRHGLTLFGYCETADLHRSIAMLRDSEVNRRWSDYMAPIMDIQIDSRTGFPFLLPLQWTLEP